MLFLIKIEKIGTHGCTASLVKAPSYKSWKGKLVRLARTITWHFTNLKDSIHPPGKGRVQLQLLLGSPRALVGRLVPESWLVGVSCLVFVSSHLWWRHELKDHRSDQDSWNFFHRFSIWLKMKKRLLLIERLKHRVQVPLWGPFLPMMYNSDKYLC